MDATAVQFVVLVPTVVVLTGVSFWQVVEKIKQRRTPPAKIVVPAPMARRIPRPHFLLKELPR